MDRHILFFPILLTLTLLMALHPDASHGQNAKDRVNDWLQAQSTQLERVESATALVASDMTLTSGPTERRIESGQRTSFDRNERGERHTEWLRVDGEELALDQERQVDRRIESMIGPELFNLTAGHFLPHRLMREASFGRRVREETRDGVMYFVVEGRLSMDGPGFDDRGVRPQGPPRGLPPGGRAGVRPGGRRPPMPGGRSLGGGIPPAPGPIRQEIKAWFRADTGALTVIEQRIDMPGGRGLGIRTELTRVNGLDVPQSRHIEGDVPSPRRLRTVTVGIAQDLTISDYEFRFNDR